MNKESKTKHEFASMEAFLIDFFKKNSNGKIKLYNMELEDYFEKCPLDRERYDKINASIRNRRDYDVICAKYGIETKKLNYEQYATERGISKKRAKMLFELKGYSYSREYVIELYYMAIDPRLLRRYIFEAQLELHNMMKAYDSLTGKNTTYEHHVGLCDGPSLGRDLFNEGFDTLEEVQEKSQTIAPLENYSYGVDASALISRGHSVSKALDKYGLENTLWRGSLQLVSGTPPFSKNPPIYAIEDYSEVKLFFRTKKIRVNEEAIKDVLNGLVYNGNCSGYDINRLLNGDIWIYFNPVVHEACDRRRAIEKLVEELKSPTSTTY